MLLFAAKVSVFAATLAQAFGNAAAPDSTLMRHRETEQTGEPSPSQPRPAIPDPIIRPSTLDLDRFPGATAPKR